MKRFLSKAEQVHIRHPEAKPKDLANEKEILRFAQNDSFAVTLGTFLITN